jgi:FAD:protein FMN transferase
VTARRLAFLILFAAVAASACSTEPSSDRAEPPTQTARTGLAMGSQLTVRVLSADAVTAESAIGAVFAEFERLDALLSVWRPGSDVLRINAAPGARPVAVGPDVVTALDAARQISDWTHGKFDVTFGALSDVWKFDHDQDGRIPTPTEIAARLPFIGYRAVQVDAKAGTVFLSRPGMRIHLGGIGKGYAVDRAVRLLLERGFRDFMIQSGGDLYVGGLEAGRPWRVGIADPRNPSQVFGTIDLSDGTLSTSGDYERAFVKDGVRYHHLLDPATGTPARGCRSVTIVSSSPLLADGLSTGVFILGPTEGMALVERLPDVEAIIVTDRNEVLVSSGLEGKFRLLTPPTGGV